MMKNFKRKKKPEVRITTAVRFPPGLHERLKVAARERDLSVNWLVNRALEEFLDRLVPAAELTLTTPSRPVGHQHGQGNEKDEV